jgi:hypothetical protein
MAGAQWAGLGNAVSGELIGAQWAGLGNAVSGNVIGAQWAGLGNAVTGSLIGAQWAGLGNAASRGLIGAQWAGAANAVSGPVLGAQWAGITNVISGPTMGAQWAGIANVVSGPLVGAQWAGITNVVSAPMTGAQWAGIANVASGPFVGVQWAGITSVVSSPMTGAQWSGIANVVSGPFVGAQWAGIGNVTAEASGLQLAGVFNRARRFGPGVQIAPVNVSTHNEGIPIGLVSYVRSVGLEYDVWADETAFLHFGIRSGVERFHNVLFVGAQPSDPFRWTAGVAVGAHLALSDSTFLIVDVSAQHIHEEGQWTDELNSLHKLRVLVGRHLQNGVSLYGGPTINYFLSRVHDGSDIAPWSLSDYRTRGRWERFWPGLVVCLRF